MKTAHGGDIELESLIWFLLISGLTVLAIVSFPLVIIYYIFRKPRDNNSQLSISDNEEK